MPYRQSIQMEKTKDKTLRSEVILRTRRRDVFVKIPNRILRTCHRKGVGKNETEKTYQGDHADMLTIY